MLANQRFFNRFTESTTWANDQLVATLEPLVSNAYNTTNKAQDTLGRHRLGSGVICLSHCSVLFTPLLEEINYSNLVLHVVDCSDIAMHDKMISVEDTSQSHTVADEIPT